MTAEQLRDPDGAARFPEWALIVCGEIAPSVEDAWNKWYDEVHLPEILRCPGFVSAARYVGGANEPHLFVTLYALDSAEAFASDEFSRARGLGPFTNDVSFRTSLYRRRLVLERDDLDHLGGVADRVSEASNGPQLDA